MRRPPDAIIFATTRSAIIFATTRSAITFAWLELSLCLGSLVSAGRGIGVVRENSGGECGDRPMQLFLRGPVLQLVLRPPVLQLFSSGVIGGRKGGAVVLRERGDGGCGDHNHHFAIIFALI